jgi:hypothetical protein
MPLFSMTDAPCPGTSVVSSLATLVRVVEPKLFFLMRIKAPENAKKNKGN